jgi:hypothetical protein
MDLKDMQIKITLRFHPTQLEWPFLRAKTTNAKDVAKHEILNTAGGNAN